MYLIAICDDEKTELDNGTNVKKLWEKIPSDGFYDRMF